MPSVFPTRPARRARDKLCATALGVFFGWSGAHRFYLNGSRNLFAWVLGLTGLGSLIAWHFLHAHFFLPDLLLAPWLFAMLASILDALIIGLTPEDKWQLRYGTGAEPRTTHWMLAVILVSGTFIGVMGLLFLIARASDLAFTGGAYG